MTCAVVPTYLRTDRDVALAIRCLRSMKKTAPDLSCVVVDDGSPNREARDQVFAEANKHAYFTYGKTENEGFSATVNSGIRIDASSDVVLVNSDIEFIEDGWLERMEQADADVVGALLLYPHGVIQHAGVYFSVITRRFNHRFVRAPYNFAPAQVPCDCPVTAALQFIRRETLNGVGLYDESFRLGFEDMDYCLRVALSGRRCLYEPTVRAYHHEGMSRAVNPSQQHLDWQQQSLHRLVEKYDDGDTFASIAPTMWLEDVYG